MRELQQLPSQFHINTGTIMAAAGITTNDSKWRSDEQRRINEEIVMHKKKQEELARRMKQIGEFLNNRSNLLDAIKKRCEETRLLLTEVTSNEKRIAAIHELEKSRYNKIQQAVDEHKAAISRIINRNDGPLYNVNKCSENMMAADQTSYARGNSERKLDERERYMSDLSRSLKKREQEITIRRNHNAARIVRLRKLLQSHEAKRSLCKEQLSALKAKANRRY